MAMIVTLAGFVALGSSASARVSISVTPANPLMDARIDVVVSGLKANAHVTLRAASRAQDGLWWRSEAEFVADARGRIDLKRQPPQSGSYRGIDAMGLIWSMRPDDSPRSADHVTFTIKDYSKPIAVAIAVEDAKGVGTSSLVIRRFADPSVVVVPIRQGIIGNLYRPAAGPPRPGVLIIGGSDGGPGEPGLAMLFASHGFAALSLSYFGEAGLPATLEGVPMEYFDRAVAWMCREPSIDSRSIAIYSESRGTEPALFTASRDPRVRAVVARSPSFVLWGGVDARHLPGAAAWTLRGKPLPYIANTLYPDFIATYLWDRLTGTAVRQTPLFLEDLAHAEDRGSVEIQVEKIRGPVMLLAGNDDQIWPSATMSDEITARLRRHARIFGDEQLKYAHVGHAIPFVYLPTSGRWQDSPFAIGGTAEGMAKAQAEAWPKILRFLSDAVARHR